MKYRRLTYQELELLESDFSDFLYHHGFNRFEWRVLQDQHSGQALKLLHKYSDQTFEKVMREVKYLQLRTKELIRTIQFKSKEYVQIDVLQEKEAQLDFSSSESLGQIPGDFFGPLRIKKSVNPYQTERENIIFNLIESGYYVVSRKVYVAFDHLRKAEQN